MQQPIGTFTQGRFEMPARIYYYETDTGGVVHHSNYLRLMERCRTEMLRALGHAVLYEDGSTYVVMNAQVNWLKPARLDDDVIVTADVRDMGAAHVTFGQTVERGEEVLFTATIRAAFVGPSLRPQRFPKDLRTAYQGLMEQAQNQ
ncbi:MAG: YbgC/FadM family acyl-CoA thioesterase [Rhodobacteraceae bacterium]|nr:YbgC/FadM family acyl-CoA thioesterase [Paracoccaceae bacterium]